VGHAVEKPPGLVQERNKKKSIGLALAARDNGPNVYLITERNENLVFKLIHVFFNSNQMV
jgi:hypothetical protein